MDEMPLNLDYLYFETDSEDNESFRKSMMHNTSGSAMNKSASQNDLLQTSADRSGYKNFTLWMHKKQRDV